MIFLQSHGAGTNLAVKLFKTYGRETVQVIKNNPYQMAKDIFGVGFKTADQIALKLGLAKDSPFRLQAALVYTLNQMASEGHCYAEENELLQKTGSLLNIAEAACQIQIEQLSFTRELIKTDDAVYLPYIYQVEKSTAEHVHRINSALFDRLDLLARSILTRNFLNLT